MDYSFIWTVVAWVSPWVFPLSHSSTPGQSRCFPARLHTCWQLSCQCFRPHSPSSSPSLQLTTLSCCLPPPYSGNTRFHPEAGLCLAALCVTVPLVFTHLPALLSQYSIGPPSPGDQNCSLGPLIPSLPFLHLPNVQSLQVMFPAPCPCTYPLVTILWCFCKSSISEFSITPVYCLLQ